MNKQWFYLVVSSILIISCEKKQGNSVNKEIIVKTEEFSSNIAEKENTIVSRFSPPKGYSSIESPKNSLGAFIENFELEKYGAPILKFNGTPLNIQNLHEAIFNIDVGKEDLQQCADSVIRLYAEFLWKEKRFDEIQFQFTSGDIMSWKDFRKGIRPKINGNNVTFSKTAEEDTSYSNFRKYLNLVFTYSGTISLNKETIAVKDNKSLKTGDMIITPGSPGHVVFIAGVAKNSENQRVYLLGEGFMPAQSIHILSNPFDKRLSPWYSLDVSSPEIHTARYLFKGHSFRTFR